MDLFISHKSLRLLINRVSGRQHLLRAARNAIRVKPCMKFHTPFVSLLHGIFQRVPHWLGSPSALAGKPLAPRLKTTLIKCIGTRSDLKYYGIAPRILQFIHLLPYVSLGLRSAFILPLRLAYYVKPRSPELMLWCGSVRCFGTCRQCADAVQ